MYPHERSLVKRLADKPFVLLGINSDRDKQKLKPRMEDEGITWRSFWDGGSTHGPIASKWNVHGWPTIYVLDHTGTIRHKNVRGEAMDRAVNVLLAEMGVAIDVAEISVAEEPPAKRAEKPKTEPSQGEKPNGS